MAKSPMTTRILDGMKELWTTRALADVTLKADSREFPVHKVMLALSSDYFMAMLTSNMVETTSNEIELKGVSAKGLEPILQYIYTGHLPISKDNICDVILASTHLQMDPVVQKCTELINKVINIGNCVDLKNVAKLCSLQDIEYLAEDYILDNFADVMKQGCHCRLDLRALLLCYFHERSDDSDAIVIGPEKRVFALMMDWIHYGDEERMTDIARVMEVVRFPLMTPADLSDVIEEVPALVSDEGCHRFILKAQEYHRSSPPSRVPLSGREARLRNYPSVLVLTVHPDTKQTLMYALCRQVAFSQEVEHTKAKWLHLVDMEGDIPKFTLDPACVASVVINDFLLLVGVYDNDASCWEAPKSCYLFDPRFSTWTKVADLNKGRYKPALVSHGGHVYALGGAASLSSSQNLDSIECYDFAKNEWEEIGHLTLKLRNHDACVLDESIFITGGRKEDETSCNVVQVFDTKTHITNTLYPMPSSRENHRLFNICHTVYMVQPNDGVLKTYQEDVQTWQKFWVRLGGPKIPEEAHVVRVGDNLVFVDGVLDQDVSESDSEDSDWERLAESEHACVELVVGDQSHGAGRVYVHDDYPAGLGKPVVLAGIRLPWHLTNGLLKQ